MCACKLGWFLYSLSQNWHLKKLNCESENKVKESLPNWRADNVLARNVSLKILSALWIFPTLWTSKQPLVNFSNHRIQIKVAYKTWISNSNLKMSFNIGCSLTKRILMFLHMLPERISGLWHKPTKFTWNPFSVHMLGLNMGLNIFNQHLELSVTHKTKVFSILVTNHTIDHFIKFSMSSWDKSNVLGRNTEEDIKGKTSSY